MASRRREIVWSDAADLDLGRAIAFLQERSPEAARDLLRAVARTVGSLMAQPELGASADLGTDALYRYLVCGQHKIFYRVQDDVILIVRVWDTRRDPQNLKLE